LHFVGLFLKQVFCAEVASEQVGSSKATVIGKSIVIISEDVEGAVVGVDVGGIERTPDGLDDGREDDSLDVKLFVGRNVGLLVERIVGFIVGGVVEEFSVPPDGCEDGCGDDRNDNNNDDGTLDGLLVGSVVGSSASVCDEDTSVDNGSLAEGRSVRGNIGDSGLGAGSGVGSGNCSSVGPGLGLGVGKGVDVIGDNDDGIVLSLLPLQ